jgi:5-methylcytosine-specific restriction endonuclease McrA
MASKYTDLQLFLISVLRKATLKWPPRTAAKIKARAQRGLYICASCSELFGPRQIVLDHIIPAIDPDVGFVDWNTYISRLFCPADNFQVICKSCHRGKTTAENARRREAKKKTS